MDENHQAWVSYSFRLFLWCYLTSHLPFRLNSEVSRIPVIGRFGTKLEFLLQYLIHIDATSRDKTLVFTSFSRGLDFVAESLKRNAIRFERLNSGASAGRAVERFKEDDSVNVLLLHSESQVSWCEEKGEMTSGLLSFLPLFLSQIKVFRSELTLCI